MGLIKTEQLANGNVGLEITYGGKEAPFGGIDSSMPPQYIDPRCQVDVRGFVIINGQFVAVSFKPISITINLPVSNFTVPKLAGFGAFYTKAQGWQNFVVINGDKTTSTGFTTANTALYVWPAANTATPTAIPLRFTQAINYSVASQATAVIVAGPPRVVAGGTAATVDVALSDGTHAEDWSEPASDSQNLWITNIVAKINTGNVATAVANADGISATVTAKFLTGNASNGTLINVYTSTALPGTYTGTYPYLQSGFQGGADAVQYPSGDVPYPISWVQVGESLYIGGPGTVILQYTNEIFTILSQYVGANILKKFSGSLIALGITPSPGTVLQNPEMIMAWSAAGKFGVWNPTDVDGNVTGAGFEQLADIGDPLTGGFVNNSTIMILRSQGVSYATATGNSGFPFDVNHVDLAQEGEGCQGSLLSSQYGPVGFYVGNTNVFEFVQSSKAVGDKIKDYLYTELQANATTPLAASKASGAYILSTECVFFAIWANQHAYLYNSDNGTWTRFFAAASEAIPTDVYIDDFPLLGASTAQFKKQAQLTLGYGDSAGKTFKFAVLTEAISVPYPNSLLSDPPTITFPLEEVSFGRDITIDGLYVLMAGTPALQVNFYVADETGTIQLQSLFTFPVGASYGTLAEYQLYFSEYPGGQSSGSAVTVKSPQLRLVLNQPAGTNQFRLAKAALFGSFDPNQRPI